MGAWDIYAFDNDDALDWFGDLEKEEPGLIRKTISTVSSFPAGEYMESFDGSIALAAVALVAAKRQPDLASRIHSSVLEWFNNTDLNPDPELLELSRKALERILGANSELKDLYEDEPDINPQWLKYMEELKNAL